MYAKQIITRSGVNEANDKKLVPITRKNGSYIVSEKRGMVRDDGIYSNAGATKVFSTALKLHAIFQK